MHEIDDIFKISKSSIENHLHQLDYVSHFDVWVSHKLRGQGVGGGPNCDREWKVDTIQYCGMEEIVGPVK